MTVIGIVTNNHVVDGADELTVTLSNRKSFKAKVVGADPASDLAVVKIDAQGLPFLLYGNSDEVKIGQWVLAVGYPLNLETTGDRRDRQRQRQGPSISTAVKATDPARVIYPDGCGGQPR